MTAASNVHHFPINREQGYTLHYRSMWENKIFRDSREVALWSWLIDHVHSKREPFFHPTKYGPVELHYGEVLIAERVLAEKFFLHRNAVRALLHRLATKGSINLSRDRSHHLAGTVLTIVNYEVYQRPRESFDPIENRSPAVGCDRSPNRSEDRSRTKTNNSTYNNVDETRRAGERGGPGGERRKASPPPPSADDRRGYGTDAALPGQPVLPAIEEVEPERLAVAAAPVEASAPELGSPSIVVEVPVDPVPVTSPPPEVGAPPAISNVVAIGVSPVRSPAKRATRWTLPAVPPEWIERGHAKREALGLPPADLEKQARRFVAYYTSADCRKPARKDWPASWMKFALDEDLPAYRMNGSSHEQRHDHHRSEPAYNDGACAYLARLLNGGG